MIMEFKTKDLIGEMVCVDGRGRMYTGQLLEAFSNGTLVLKNYTAFRETDDGFAEMDRGDIIIVKDVAYFTIRAKKCSKLQK